MRELVLEKLAEKAAAKKKASTKGRLQAEAIELLGERIGALDLWTRVPPGERRTLVTREDLAAAAVRIADTEGLAALSMRRLATEVGVGTMTLYHYVRNKDELLTLLVDTVMGELLVPEVPAGWREALVALAEQTKATLERHPWILQITDDPPLGPNSVRHFDQTVQAVASLDLPLGERLEVARMVDEYVFGHCLWVRDDEHPASGPGPDPDAELLEYLATLLETGAYPSLSALVAGRDVREVWEEIAAGEADAGRFRRNLDCMLDGVEARLRRR